MFRQSKNRSGDENRGAVASLDLQLRDLALACVGRLLFAEEDVEPLGAEQTCLHNSYDELRDVDIRQALNNCLVIRVIGVEPVCKGFFDPGQRFPESVLVPAHQ